MNGESPIHQIGSCFVWKWRPKKIKTSSYFQKNVYSKLKTQENKKYTCFLKNYAGIDSKHTIGSTRERRIWRSRALHLQRENRHHSGSSNGCSSHRPQSVVYWDLPLAEFSMTEKCKSPLCEDSSGQKKETRVMTMIWILLQFLVERCKTQIFQGV